MTKMQTTRPTEQHVNDVAKQTGTTAEQVRQMVANFCNATVKYDNKRC